MAMSIVEAWQVIMALRHQPAALILARQALPTLDREKYAPASGLVKGAFVLADARDGSPPFNKGAVDANRHDRVGAHGREHGAPADPRRA
jgi:hypothetical protein